MQHKEGAKWAWHKCARLYSDEDCTKAMAPMGTGSDEATAHANMLVQVDAELRDIERRAADMERRRGLLRGVRAAGKMPVKS